MSSKEKDQRIFVRPKKGEIVPFEGRQEKIPEEGAKVHSSTYYRRLLSEGSLLSGKVSNKNTEKKGA